MTHEIPACQINLSHNHRQGAISLFHASILLQSSVQGSSIMPISQFIQIASQPDMEHIEYVEEHTTAMCL